jgi:hypothetical protein
MVNNFFRPLSFIEVHRTKSHQIQPKCFFPPGKPAAGFSAFSPPARRRPAPEIDFVPN